MIGSTLSKKTPETSVSSVYTMGVHVLVLDSSHLLLLDSSHLLRTVLRTKYISNRAGWHRLKNVNRAKPRDDIMCD